MTRERQHSREVWTQWVRDVAGPLRLSLAVPLRDAEHVLPELLGRIGAVLDALPGGPHEVVLVDDGSRDRTLALLEAAAARDPRLVVVALSRNFGYRTALAAALDFVTGDATVVMDGALGDAPETIPRFVDQFRRGYDVVSTRRTRRRLLHARPSEGSTLRRAYDAFDRAATRVSDRMTTLGASDFCLLSRRVVEQLRRAPERHRHLPGLRSWVGFRQTAIEVDRQEPQAGARRRSAWARLARSVDGVLSFSILPLRAAATLGLVTVGLTSLYALYAAYAKLSLGRSPEGFTATILVVSFLCGVNLLLLGVIGEYVGRIYEEVKRRPPYVVGRVVRGDAGRRDPGAAARAPAQVGAALPR